MLCASAALLCAAQWNRHVVRRLTMRALFIGGMQHLQHTRLKSLPDLKGGQPTNPSATWLYAEKALSPPLLGILLALATGLLTATAFALHTTTSTFIVVIATVGGLGAAGFALYNAAAQNAAAH
jgi:hypothetical protein